MYMGGPGTCTGMPIESDVVGEWAGQGAEMDERTIFAWTCLYQPCKPFSQPGKAK